MDSEDREELSHLRWRITSGELVDSEDREELSHLRWRITWVVVCVGVATYVVVWLFGNVLPEWMRYAIFLIVILVAIAADAWELGVRRVVDPDRWWRVLLLFLVAVVGIVWLWVAP